MKEPKCPRCGAEMLHIRCPFNSAMYECPECEYQDYIQPTRKTLQRTYCGEIVGMFVTDEGETVLRIKLDDPEESFTHCHVRIIEGEPA